MLPNSSSLVLNILLLINLALRSEAITRYHNNFDVKIVGSDDEVLQPLFVNDNSLSEMKNEFSIPRSSRSKRSKSRKSAKRDTGFQGFDEQSLLKAKLDIPAFQSVSSSSNSVSRAFTSNQINPQSPLKLSLDLPSIQASQVRSSIKGIADQSQQIFSNQQPEKNSELVFARIKNRKTHEGFSFQVPYSNIGVDDLEVLIFKSNMTKIAPGTVITNGNQDLPAPGTVITTGNQNVLAPGTVIARTTATTAKTTTTTTTTTKDKPVSSSNNLTPPIELLAELPFTSSSQDADTPLFDPVSNENRTPSNLNDNVASKQTEIPAVPIQKKIRSLDEKSINALDFYLTYTGPKIDLETEINVTFVSSILVPFFKSGKVLDRKSSYSLFFRAYQEFLVEEALHEINLEDDEKILIFGDIHGQFPDFIKIIEKEGPPSSKLKYIFNGDIVDRGAYSIECLMTLLAFKVAEPDNFFISLGNHETASVGKLQFYKESVKKYGNDEFFKLAHALFRSFPPAYLIQSEVFVTHGGITPDLTLDHIRQIDRVEPDQEDGDVINDLIWSDPVNTNGTTSSHRGLGFLFGPDATHEFVKQNNISVIIRSHQYKEIGFSEQHDGLCITIFSCPNYRGKMPNYGAYIKLDSQLNLTYNIFKAAENNCKKDYPTIPADTQMKRNVRRIR